MGSIIRLVVKHVSSLPEAAGHRATRFILSSNHDLSLLLIPLMLSMPPQYKPFSWRFLCRGLFEPEWCTRMAFR